MRTLACASALVAVVAALLVAARPSRCENVRPVIGIMTLPCDSPSFCHSSTSYLAASYPKWIEGGGAQVVPVHYELGGDELRALVRQLNGVLFTGGGASLAAGAPYMVAAQTVYDEVATINAAGTYLPLWGTCMGFEAVVIAQARNSSVLQSGFNSENLTLALDATPLAKGSVLFDPRRAGAADALQVMATQNVTMNNHQDGITPARFAATPALASYFDVLATNRDRNGTEFVSLIEGKSGFVFASQFHPEKNVYEWDANEVIQHTGPAVRSMQYLAETLVGFARQNNNRFATPAALNKALIYGTPAVYTGDVSSFTQAYFWNFTAA